MIEHRVRNGRALANRRGPGHTFFCCSLQPVPYTLFSVTMDSTLNSRLTMIQLADTDGREVRLGSLWLQHPAVVVFLRHYG